MGESRTGACAVPNGASAVRRVHFHDGEAPVAAVVAPSVFVAARDGRNRLLVRRWDSGAWEFGQETIDAAWFDPTDVAELPVELGASRWITSALLGAPEPHLD